MSSQKQQFIDQALTQRKKQHRFRELNSYIPRDDIILSDGRRELINFSGNDYLGLSKHPLIIERVKQYAERYGAGSAASRLISGTYRIHEDLEQKIAATFRREAALIFNSGFQANSTIINTLADRHSLILADKLSHNSLLQGSLASRATFQRFEHNSKDDLEQKLKKLSNQFSRIFIITESLFSMDGDRSDLSAIADLAQKHNAWFFVDDAHAVGVWGEQGLGLTYGMSEIDLVLGTCGKAFGSFGAFLLCSSQMKQYLINFCPGFIYSTALPPPVIGAIDGALELIPGLEKEREHLYHLIKKMKKGIKEAGFSTGHTESQIIPIMVGDDEQTLRLDRYLRNKGFLATAIRPPTVPRGSARLRITLSSAHTEDQITKFLRALNNWSHG